jgi:hypothetical protein
MRFGVLFVLAAATAAAVVASGDALAVGTRTFELDSLEKLSGGDVKGASIGSDGVVRAGWTLGDVPLPSDAGSTVTCAVALADGSVIVGTGPASGGKIVRIANDQALVLADTKESAVNALAVDRAGTIYAATTSGRIYKVAQGKATVFATLTDVDAVLSLVIDKAGTGLYAGTGSSGKVMHVDASGASSIYFSTDDTFVVSLALAPDGTVYAGTSGKGLLYRITAAGRANVLYDFPGADVHAVALGPGGTTFAIVNEEATGASAENAESPPRRGASSRSPAGPSSAGRTKPGKGTLWRFDARGRPERMMHHDEFHYVSLAVDERGTPYVGTGADGRVYTVDESHAVSLVADTDERQAGALGVGRLRFVVGSDPAVFHRVVSIGGPDAVWTSKPLDAGLRARFGHVTWQSTGAVEVSTRSGDTSLPDSTWSAWQGPVPPGGPVPNPPARFVQVRARLRDASASIADVIVPFATENLRAVVTDVEAREKGVPREAVATKDALPPSGGEPPKHESVVHVSWKVDNPDSDELRYRVQFRREGQNRWLDATDPSDVLTKPELDWDTVSLPEGNYRVRVDASDEIANPPDDVTHSALESAPVRVDNTPPVFKTLTMNGKRLRAEVVDGIGPIARVEVAVDGRNEWRPLSPADGLFDTADETIDADIASLLPLAPGPHLVAVRAFDAAGNAVVREVEAP